MITIPDQSLKRVFATTRYIDIPLGRPYTAKFQLENGSQNICTPEGDPNGEVAVTIRPITWTYAGKGIQEDYGEEYSAVGDYNSSNGTCTVLLPALTAPGGYIVTLTWYTENPYYKSDGKTNGIGSPVLQKQYAMGYLARDYMPFYQSIRPEFQIICQEMLNEWELLRDNAYGNNRPALSENLQVHFSYETVAHAMDWELAIFQQQVLHPTHYNLTNFPLPMPKYDGLIRLLTQVQMSYKTAIGYLETPEFADGPDVAYAQRNDYYAKWYQQYEGLSKIEKKMMSIYQLQNLGLSQGALLVAGGYFQTGSGLLTNQMIDAIGNGTLQNMFFPVWFDLGGGDTNQVPNTGVTQW